MASTTCNDLTVNVNCISNMANVSFENGGEGDNEAIIEVPPGGILADPNGTTLYENTSGGPKKCYIRIP